MLKYVDETLHSTEHLQYTVREIDEKDLEFERTAFKVEGVPIN